MILQIHLKVERLMKMKELELVFQKDLMQLNRGSKARSFSTSEKNDIKTRPHHSGSLTQGQYFYDVNFIHKKLQHKIEFKNGHMCLYSNVLLELAGVMNKLGARFSTSFRNNEPGDKLKANSTLLQYIQGIYDSAQEAVYILMNHSSFPRFQRSGICKELMLKLKREEALSVLT